MPSKKSKAQKKKQLDSSASVSGPRKDSIQADEPPPPYLAALSGRETPELAPPDEAEPTSTVETDPRIQAERLKEQGNDAFKAKRYGEAIDTYTKALALCPTEPTYLTNRAACHMALKSFRLALTDCREAATLQAATPSPKTLVRLAKCHLALGAPNPALTAVRAALSVDSTHSPAREVERTALRMEQHLARFETARSQKDWEVARLALDQAVQTCEGSEPIGWRCWRIELELARGKCEQASLIANAAFQIDKMEPDVLYLRGLVMFLGGKLPAALQHAQLALTFAPDHARARTLMRRVRSVERLKDEGNALFKAGNLVEAVVKYSGALDAVGTSAEEAGGGAIRATLLSNRATALLKLDRNKEALVDTDASLELVSTSYKALRTRARIHKKLENYQEAVNDYKAALEQVRAEGSQAEERTLKQELREAEVALKRSKTKDYYKILEVSKDCTEQEVKKAYRKQCLLHHPDRGGNEEKFKLALEAYNVLSDPQKRARYDAGEDEEEIGMGGGMNRADLAEMFAAFGGGGGFSFGGFEGGSQFGGGRFHTHANGGSPF